MRYISIIMLLLVIGCTPSVLDKSAERDSDTNTERITYENQEERNKDSTSFTGYEKSKRRLEQFKDDDDHPLTDQYVNEKTREISNHLQSLQAVNSAQVAETDDRIVIGVILNNHADQHIGNMIESEVRKYVNDKDVVVYTDDTYWYKQRNLKAKSNATQIGEDLEEIFDNFFKIND